MIIDSASGGNDFSSASNDARLEASLGGIRQLTRQAIGFHDNSPQPGHMTWDNSNLNMPVNSVMTSPRPIPDILEEDAEVSANTLPTPDISAPSQPAPHILSDAARGSILASLQDVVKDQLNSAFDRINDSLILSIEEAAKISEKNKSDIEDMAIRVDERVHGCCQ